MGLWATSSSISSLFKSQLLIEAYSDHPTYQGHLLSPWHPLILLYFFYFCGAEHLLISDIIDLFIFLHLLFMFVFVPY